MSCRALLLLVCGCLPSFAQAPKLFVSVRLTTPFRVTTLEAYSDRARTFTSRLTQVSRLGIDVKQVFRDQLMTALAKDKRFNWQLASAMPDEAEAILWTWQNPQYQRPQSLGPTDRLVIANILDIFALQMAQDIYEPNARIGIALVDDARRQLQWETTSFQARPKQVKSAQLDATMKEILQSSAQRLAEGLLKFLQ